MCKCKCWTNFKDFFPGLMRGLAMAVILAAVICCIVGFFCPKFEYLNADNIVITFLGALAAFVVISNYALMVETRNNAKEDLEKMGKKVEKIAGLEEYYDYSIKKDIAELLSKSQANDHSNTDPSTMKTVYAGNLTYFVRTRVSKKENGIIEKDKWEYWYFFVDLGNKNAERIKKEQFDEREII